MEKISYRSLLLSESYNLCVMRRVPAVYTERSASSEIKLDNSVTERGTKLPM